MLSAALAAAGCGIASGGFCCTFGELGPLLGHDPIAGSHAGVNCPLREPCAFLGFLA
ncbi:MAG: hypothetical protein JO134_23335 [Xanthobacteraceae bacterium]|nr:hypothetical protein [Xanthobacteraceae bacterium]